MFEVEKSDTFCTKLHKKGVLKPKKKAVVLDKQPSSNLRGKEVHFGGMSLSQGAHSLITIFL